MSSYISNSLIHWTGRNKNFEEAYSTLEKIINSEILWLSFCPIHNSAIEDCKIMMVCFTDIPLSLSEEHCNTFGKFGIAFNKNRMIGYGANPVFYLTDKNNNRLKEVYNFLTKALDKERDREFLEGSENFDYSTEQIYSLLEIFGFTQEYYSNTIEKEFYYEREWRINCQTLKIVSGQNEPESGQAKMLGITQKNGMKFDLSDIDFMIVPNSFYDKACLAFPKLKVKIYENEIAK